MTDSDLLARLIAHRTLGGVPRDELAWLVAHGEIRHFAPGDDIVGNAPGGPEYLYVVLSGRFAIHIAMAGGKGKVMEWRGGDVTGRLPYSRQSASVGDVIVEEPTEMLRVHGDHFPEMIRECPAVTATLVHVMVDRARAFNSSYLHDEKMVSLGKLSAGLAHELNNPASAATRSASLLANGLTEAEQASQALGTLRLSDSQLGAIDVARGLCLTTPVTVSRSPIERADREDAIAAWLDAHEVDQGAAAALSDTAVTIQGLDALAGALDGQALEAALRCIAVGCSTRALAMEVEKSTSRIYQLVSAVKGFTYMDRAAVPEPVDVGRGLTDTLVVLASKARGKSVSVSVDLTPDMPRVRGVGGELNQIWANLLNNALDAAPESGHVSVTATKERNDVVVRVRDDGAGIPEAIRDRVFDPFFTTKPVGSGTGLGLDIVRRLVMRQNGRIEFESRPGRTEFRVTLPALIEAPVTTNAVV